MKRLGQGHKARKWHCKIQTQSPCLYAIMHCSGENKYGPCSKSAPLCGSQLHLLPTACIQCHAPLMLLSHCALVLFLSLECLPSLLHLIRPCLLVKDQVRCPSLENFFWLLPVSGRIHCSCLSALTVISTPF